MLKLPGGLIIDGSLVKTFTLHPVSGKRELALAEITSHAKQQHLSHPQWISQVLQCIVASIGSDQQPSLAQINRLCLADRQKIIISWRQQYNSSTRWLTQQCAHCESSFDVNFNLDELPFSRPGTDYPHPSAQTTQGNIILRIPNGLDMQAIAIMDNDNAREYLLENIIENSDVNCAAFNEKDKQTIEKAIEDNVPELARAIQAKCPYCNHQHAIDLNPYEELTSDIDPLLDDVHKIAMVYHWTEDSILDLPYQRRQQYLERIGTTSFVAEAWR